MENDKNIDEDTAEKAGVTDSPMSTTLNMLAIETIINMRCNEKELLIFQNFQITNSVPIIVERSLLHTNITFDHFTHILNDPYIYS